MVKDKVNEVNKKGSDNPSCAYIASSDAIRAREDAINAHRKMNPHVVVNAPCCRSLDFATKESTKEPTKPPMKRMKL